VTDNRAELILTLRDEISSGAAKVNAGLRQIRQATEDLGQSGKKAGEQHAAAFTDASAKAGSYANQLLAVAGITISIAGAAYLVQKAYSSWFSLISGGIGIVDDYQKKIIGTSYILTTMSEVKTPDLSKAYGQWNDYFAWLYQQSLDVDKKAAASAQDIFAVSVELAKKGVVAASNEEMLTIARLTDLMKAVTPGYMNFEQQARGEIMAMMEGTARMGAQTAQILSQIDPAFKENIKSAREQGKVLEYINSILPQIKQYTQDLMGTWDAVGASLKSAWSVINLKAFGDAHREVVDLAQQVSNKLVYNGQLTKEGEAAAQSLALAWGTAKGTVVETIDYLLNNSPKAAQGVATIASAVGTIASAAIQATLGIAKLIDYLDDLSKSRIGMAIIGMGLGYSRGGLPGAVVGGLAGEALSGEAGRQAERNKLRDEMGVDSETSFWIQAYRASQKKLSVGLQAQLGLQETLAEARAQNKERLSAAEYKALYPEAPKSATAPITPKIRPFSGEEDAGKGAAAAQNSLENFIARMDQETARAAGEGMAMLDAWWNKESQTLDHLAAKGVDVTKGREALDAAYYSKKEKLDEDFNLYVAKNSGDAFQAIDAQYLRDLQRYGNTQDRKAEVYDIWARKTVVQEIKNEDERLGRQKEYLGRMASYTPLLGDQLALQREILGLEQEQGRHKLDIDYWTGKITREEWKALEALRAQTAEMANQAQRRKDWAREGAAGGLKMYSFERLQGMETRAANEIVDTLKRSESWLGENFGNAAANSLLHRKQDLTKIWEDIFSSAISWSFKHSAQAAYDFLAKIIRGAGSGGGLKGMTNINSGNTAAGNINTGNNSAVTLEDAADRLDEAATGQNEAASSSYGAATAGIAASASLGLAGIGILTGSQTLMTAATAISVAATLLQIAASLDLLPFHTGGVVAHQGWLVAHDGLALDERRVIVRLGEGILQNAAMDKWAAAGVGFDLLNDPYRLPAMAVPLPIPLPVPVGGQGGGGTPVGGPSILNIPLTINQIDNQGRISRTQQYQLTVDLVNQGIKHNEIRIPKGS
jgi:hypothetical protein